MIAELDRSCRPRGQDGSDPLGETSRAAGCVRDRTCLGTIRIGVLVLYRDRPGALDPEELARGLVLADVASQVILALPTGAPDGRVHEGVAHERAHWAKSIRRPG